MLAPPDSSAFPINSRAFLYLVSKGYIAAPSIDSKNIWEKSKSDRFAKFAAGVQSIYVVVEIIAHSAQNLGISCLETLTAAFLTCTTATFLFWLEKPKDVGIPVYIHMETPISQILQDAGPAAEIHWQDTPMDFVEQSGWNVWNRRKRLRNFGGLHTRPLQRIPNDYIVPPMTIRMAVLCRVLSVLYPTVHLARWNFEFPTLWELYL
ncbi:hypothetical protein GQ53DRAFT_881169 [Thozetella sp. PMI_491]|nr:hypothetical protein GQ53DRAFT_881169 [Thozetella sp. PMI_491]